MSFLVVEAGATNIRIICDYYSTSHAHPWVLGARSAYHRQGNAEVSKSKELKRKLKAHVVQLSRLLHRPPSI